MAESRSIERWQETLADTTGVDVTDTDTVHADVTVNDIGGIETATVTLEPGTTILTGENATNRTSFLKALNGVLGGTQPVVRGTEDTGTVTLQFKANGDPTGNEFERTFHRDSPRIEGTGVCDDTDLVDTFATLLEDNAARQAIRRNENIRDVLMRPVDTNELEAEIRSKQQHRDKLQSRLREIENAVDREVQLTEKLERLENEIDDIEADIDEMQDVVDEYEAGEDMAEEAEELVEELENARERKRELQNKHEVLNAELDGLEEDESELREKRRELYQDHVQDDHDDAEDIGEVDTLELTTETGETIEDIEAQIPELQARKDEMNSVIDDLTRIIELNSNIDDSVLYTTPDDESTKSITSELDPGSKTVVCRATGQTVEKQAIEDQTEKLREQVQEKRGDVNTLEREIDDLQDTVSGLANIQGEWEYINDQLTRIDTKQKALQDQIYDVEDDIETVEADIDELEDEATETAELRESDLLDAYEELNELQFERGRKQNEIEDTERELEEISGLKDERETVESELDAVKSEIKNLRTRVEDLEREVVEAFNDHMETILDRLRYANIGRIWLERRVPDTQRGEIVTGDFELHVVREPEDGGAYESRLDTLSESEREVTGLIVALAGYLVHDVAEHVPFLLLDSVEAIDANRLIDFIDSLTEHTPFLVTALLPEDAAEFPDDIRRVTADELN